MSDGGLNKLNTGYTKPYASTLADALGKGKGGSSIATSLVAQNKEAAKLAAQLEVGSAATKIAVSQLKGNLPPLIGLYADHPLFSIAVANAAATGIKHFAPSSKKANMLADAMVQSAMVEMIQSFEVGKMIEELISGVNLSSLEGHLSEE